MRIAYFALWCSLNVSDMFGKRHDKLLDMIEKLECSEGFSLLHFKETSYRDSFNREQPMFLMTKHGFAFLVMGSGA